MLSLSGLRRDRLDSPRREPVKRSSSLPELDIVFRNCSFSTCASDDMMTGLDSRSIGKFGSGYFDEGPVHHIGGELTVPKVKSITFETPAFSLSADELMNREGGSVGDGICEEMTNRAFPTIFRSPSSLLHLGPRLGSGPVRKAQQPKLQIPADPVSPTLPPIESYSPRLGDLEATPRLEPAPGPALGSPVAAAAADAVPGAPPSKAVQSLLQFLKPLQDQHTQRVQRRPSPMEPGSGPASPERSSSPSGFPDAPAPAKAALSSPPRTAPATPNPSSPPVPPSGRLQSQQQLLMTLLQEQGRKQEELRQKKLQQAVRPL
eukprot:TRINITY_DN3407_c0_g1_i1.p1 TRINITY_DN3407_c0_g1~~TRINITY_DN3407_c0_g1_i1.p1  ORF type:complete len:319 (-),score=60.80 TRINITY_DN3407_c0_g1_i1:551-1507(-)